MLAYLVSLTIRRMIQPAADHQPPGLGHRNQDHRPKASAIAAAEGVALYEVVRRAKLYRNSSGAAESWRSSSP